MVQKTYGVFGLLEWNTVIKLGERDIKVEFTGGTRNNNGVIPAKYTTSNEIVQFAIEHSAHYKSGRIKLVKSLVVAEPTAEASAAVAGDPATESQGTEAGSATPTVPSSEGEAVEKFSCLEDAQEWLMEACGLKKSSILTKKACVEAGAEKGVTLEFEH